MKVGPQPQGSEEDERATDPREKATAWRSKGPPTAKKQNRQHNKQARDNNREQGRKQDIHAGFLFGWMHILGCDVADVLAEGPAVAFQIGHGVDAVAVELVFRLGKDPCSGALGM